MANFDRWYLAVTCAALVSSSLSVQAKDDSSKSASDKPAVAAAASPDASKSGASVNISTADALKAEEQQLKRMAEIVKRVHRAGMDLIGECTQPIEMAGEIDIIGQDVIPIMPATAEGFGTQYLPPRPKYIGLHVTQLASLVPILQDEINTLTIPESEKTAASQPLDDLKGNANDLALHLQVLQKMVAASDYNQFNLANEGRGIIATIKQVDSARKKLLHEDTKLEKTEKK